MEWKVTYGDEVDTVSSIEELRQCIQNMPPGTKFQVTMNVPTHNPIMMQSPKGRQRITAWPAMRAVTMGGVSPAPKAAAAVQSPKASKKRRPNK